MPPETKYGTPTTSGPVPIRGYQNLLNSIVRGLQRVPLVNRGVGKRLLTLEVVGRKSGKTYRIPVAFTRHQGKLLIGTAAKKWVSNLRDGEPIQVTIGNKTRRAVPVVHTDEDDIMRLYDVIARDNRQNAAFNGIGYDADGAPNKADIYQAWQLGAAVIELTL